MPNEWVPRARLWGRGGLVDRVAAVLAGVPLAYLDPEDRRHFRLLATHRIKKIVLNGPRAPKED